MSLYHPNTLPNYIEEQLNVNGKLDATTLKKALNGLTQGKRTKRALLHFLHVNPESWDTNPYNDTVNGPRGQQRRLRQYLSGHNLDFSASDISRSLDACSIEMALGLNIGSQKEGALRPLAPLLKQGKQAHLHAAWDEAQRLAGNKKITAKHTERVMTGDGFQSLTARKAKKQLPIGNKKEDRKSLRRDLRHTVKKLKNAEDIHALVKKARQLRAKQKGQQCLNKQE